MKMTGAFRSSKVGNNEPKIKPSPTKHLVNYLLRYAESVANIRDLPTKLDLLRSVLCVTSATHNEN